MNFKKQKICIYKKKIIKLKDMKITSFSSKNRQRYNNKSNKQITNSRLSRKTLLYSFMILQKQF